MLDAQLDYLVDLGMTPDADDSTAEEFSRSLSPSEEAEFVRIADEDGGDTEQVEEPGPVEPSPDDDGDDTGAGTVQRGETNDPGPIAGGANNADVADLIERQLAAREQTRIERAEFINDNSEGIPNDLIQRALRENWTQERTATEFLRSSRERPAPVAGGGRAPAGHSHASQTGITLEALQAGILEREGFDLDDNLFRRRESRAMLGRDHCRGGWISQLAAGNIQRSESREENRTGYDRFQRARDEGQRYAGRSLVDFCRMALQVSGRTIPDDEGDMIRRALSTTQLTAVFSTSVNMQIIDAYLGLEDTTGPFVKPADVKDFKTVERGRMTKGSGLKKQARGGKANPIEFGDEVEKYKIARYAGKFEVCEEDVIDDSFGGLSEFTPREIGELAAEIKPDLVFAILLGNPSMRDGKALFHADHQNLLANGLSLSGLDAMKVAMRTQTENGRGVRNALRYLIVPEALEFRASQLMASAETRNASSTEQEGTANPLRNRFQVISDPRLDNGVTDPDTGTTYGGSETAWFGASRVSANSIEVGYRRGTGRAPRTSTYRLTEDRVGMGWKVDFDIGAKAIDWRSVAKSVA